MNQAVQVFEGDGNNPDVVPRYQIYREMVGGNRTWLRTTQRQVDGETVTKLSFVKYPQRANYYANEEEALGDERLLNLIWSKSRSRCFFGRVQV